MGPGKWRRVLGPARVVFIVIGLAAAACSSTRACTRGPGAGSCLHILFIGNSYTSVNDLPHMFAQLAKSGGHGVETGVAAPGGWTLSAHARSAETLNKLKSSKWDFVVLQEQSQVPASEQARTLAMYPAGRSLVRQIEEGGAMPIFFLTWAHRDGWPEGGLPGYDAMQSRISDGYLRVAQELGVPVAPVGEAWLSAKGDHPELELWQGDGSHASEQGTYLAACVFYATIFSQSPEGLSYRAGVSKETALALQTTASNVVLKDPKRWNLR
jgi:Domain of unknown function (DUF4886)